MLANVSMPYFDLNIINELANKMRKNSVITFKIINEFGIVSEI